MLSGMEATRSAVAALSMLVWQVMERVLQHMGEPGMPVTEDEAAELIVKARDDLNEIIVVHQMLMNLAVGVGYLCKADAPADQGATGLGGMMEDGTEAAIIRGALKRFFLANALELEPTTGVVHVEIQARIPRGDGTTFLQRTRMMQPLHRCGNPKEPYKLETLLDLLSQGLGVVATTPCNPIVGRAGEHDVEENMQRHIMLALAPKDAKHFKDILGREVSLKPKEDPYGKNKAHPAGSTIRQMVLKQIVSAEQIPTLKPASHAQFVLGGSDGVLRITMRGAPRFYSWGTLPSTIRVDALRSKGDVHNTDGADAVELLPINYAKAALATAEGTRIPALEELKDICPSFVRLAEAQGWEAETLLWLAAMVGLGMVSVPQRCILLFNGVQQSGKTTLVKVLCELVESHERCTLGMGANWDGKWGGQELAQGARRRIMDTPDAPHVTGLAPRHTLVSEGGLGMRTSVLVRNVGSVTIEYPPLHLISSNVHLDIQEKEMGRRFCEYPFSASMMSTDRAQEDMGRELGGLIACGVLLGAAREGVWREVFQKPYDNGAHLPRQLAEHRRGAQQRQSPVVQLLHDNDIFFLGPIAQDPQNPTAYVALKDLTAALVTVQTSEEGSKITRPHVKQAVQAMGYTVANMRLPYPRLAPAQLGDNPAPTQMGEFVLGIELTEAGGATLQNASGIEVFAERFLDFFAAVARPHNKERPFVQVAPNPDCSVSEKELYDALCTWWRIFHGNCSLEFTEMCNHAQETLSANMERFQKIFPNVETRPVFKRARWCKLEMRTPFRALVLGVTETMVKKKLVKANFDQEPDGSVVAYAPYKALVLAIASTVVRQYPTSVHYMREEIDKLIHASVNRDSNQQVDQVVDEAINLIFHNHEVTAADALIIFEDQLQVLYVHLAPELKLTQGLDGDAKVPLITQLRKDTEVCAFVARTAAKK